MAAALSPARPKPIAPLVGRLVEASGVGAFCVAIGWRRNASFPPRCATASMPIARLLAKGVRGSSIMLAGDEAGGGLAFAVPLAVRNAGLEMPGGLVALSPWADLSLSGRSVLQPQKRYRAGLGKAVSLRPALLTQIQSRRYLCLAGLRQSSRISRR